MSDTPAEPITWEVDSLPDLCGLREACDIVGCGKSTMTRWMEPGSGPHGERMTYMCPWKDTARGPVFTVADVEKFARLFGHQRRAAAGE